MSDNPDEDRDVIDLANPAEQHLDWVRNLIAARAPEIDAGQIADAYGIPTEAEADPGPIWNEVMERMIDAVEALEQRLNRIEAGLRG